ncbi:MAG: hypothetical protein KC420_14785, partial [Myxococcales bacterium]|nr:hypothetical protein [Myxococcales bacterium]
MQRGDDEGGDLEEVAAVDARARADRAEAALAAAMTALAQREREFEAALARIGHEIRNQLVGILGLVDVALAEDATLSRAEMLLVKRSGEGLHELVDDLVEGARLLHAGVRLRREEFVPAELVADVAALYRARAGAGGLSLRVEVGEGATRSVRGDAGRLHQILCNLVSNAIKFTAIGGVIVRVAQRVVGGEQRLSIAVEDSGIGIREDELGRIFAPFVQANPEVGRRYGGSGLGLAICRRLAEAMGGELRVISAVGVGTTFSCEVPVEVSA